MPAPNNPLNNITEAFNLRDIVGACLRRWYWFVVCALLALGVAEYLTMTKIPVYSRYASILIKDPMNFSVL